MKKIPPGSEASNVLVGEVDFLDHAIIAFVRLKNAVLLGDITEVCTCMLILSIKDSYSELLFHVCS